MSGRKSPRNSHLPLSVKPRTRPQSAQTTENTRRILFPKFADDFPAPAHNRSMIDLRSGTIRPSHSPATPRFSRAGYNTARQRASTSDFCDSEVVQSAYNIFIINIYFANRRTNLVDFCRKFCRKYVRGHLFLCWIEGGGRGSCYPRSLRHGGQATGGTRHAKPQATPIHA